MIGSLSDTAVADIVQLVHAGVRTGTLVLKRDDDLAHISFHRGRIVSAWGPTSISVCELLVRRGMLQKTRLDETVAEHAALMQPVPLGLMLVRKGMVTADELREAITHKVSRTLSDLIGWSHGSFRFDPDEVRGDQEIALAPGDVIPQPAATDRARMIHLVTEDIELVARFGARLGGGVRVRTVALHDAGETAPGELAPLVLVDMRAGVRPPSVDRLRKRHPRSLVVAIATPAVDPSELYALGVGAVVPPDAASIAACCGTLLGASRARS